jgi:hypothetical protein
MNDALTAAQAALEDAASRGFPLNNRRELVADLENARAKAMLDAVPAVVTGEPTSEPTTPPANGPIPEEDYPVAAEPEPKRKPESAHPTLKSDTTKPSRRKS